MAKRITKKQAAEQEQALFLAALDAFIRENGGTDSPDWYRWVLPTTVGPLYVDTWTDAPYIFTRFDDPAGAKAAGFDCNPYSGKWNHHHDDGMANLAAFRRLLAKVLPAVTAPA